MMSSTAECHTPRGSERSMGHATWFAVIVTVSVTTMLVASAVRSMAVSRVSDRSELIAAMGAGTVTSFGPIPSHLGRLHGEVVSHPDLVSGTNQRWTVRLTTPAGTGIDSAPVAVEAYMPETGERMLPVPSVRFVGNGRYVIEGLRFSRTGWWNVGLAVRFAFGGDSLAFNLILAR